VGLITKTNTTEEHKVSVIIPTYNSGEIFAECLKSVQNQSYPLHETIVVDNFSTDNTIKTAKKFGAKVIQQKSNPALARNIGIANATGEYVLFLDSDQVLSRSLINECVEKCKDSKVGMLRVPEVFVGKGFWSVCSAVWKNYYERVEQLYVTSENLIRSKPRFFIKEQVIRVGMFNTVLLWGEDDDLYSNLKKISVEEALAKSKIYHYEVTSIKQILTKNIRYGKSMPTFTQQTRKKILPSLSKHALLTLREILKDFKKSPTIIAGCAFLLLLKVASVAIGLLAGLHQVRNSQKHREIDSHQMIQYLLTFRKSDITMKNSRYKRNIFYILLESKTEQT